MTALFSIPSVPPTPPPPSDLLKFTERTLYFTPSVSYPSSLPPVDLVDTSIDHHIRQVASVVARIQRLDFSKSMLRIKGVFKPRAGLRSHGAVSLAKVRSGPCCALKGCSFSLSPVMFPSSILPCNVPTA